MRGVIKGFERRARRTPRDAGGEVATPPVIELDSRKSDGEIEGRGANAFDPASEPIELVHFATFGQGARVTAIVGVERDCGASSLAEALATRSALGGAKTLLLDVSVSEPAHQTPDGGALVDLAAVRDNRAFDRVTLRPEGREMFVFRDATSFRRLLDDDFSRYDSIVVDTAPLLGSQIQPLPGRLAIVGADSVVLVCLAAQITKRSLSESMRAIEEGRANLAGVVVNRRDQPSLGAELAREMRRVRRFVRVKWLARLEARFLASKFLDIHT